MSDILFGISGKKPWYRKLTRSIWYYWHGLGNRIRRGYAQRMMGWFPDKFCGGCCRFQPDIAVRRMSTLYSDAEMNYIFCCGECFDEVEEYWEERWDEYNRGRL